MKRIFVFWVLGCFGLAAFLSAQVDTLTPSFRLDAPYSCTIYPVTDMIVEEGRFGYRVDIANRSAEPVEFSILATYSNMYGGGEGAHATQRDRFKVPAGTQRTFYSDVLVTSPANRSWGSPNVHFHVSGPGIRHKSAGSVYANRTHGGNTNSHYAAFIGRLYGQVGASISSDKKAKTKIEVGRMDPGFLPILATGYMGWDWAAIHIADWMELKSKEKRALLDWVRSGGQLVFSTSSATQLQITHLENEFKLARKGASVALGFGEIHSLDTLSTQQWFKWATTNSGKQARLIEPANPQWLGSAWADIIDDTPIAINAVFVSLFMIAFAIVIGPINLIKLAPATKRFRIFITTPLISAGASLILIAVILLGDGVGGDMHQSTLAYLDRAEGHYHIDQSSIVRSSLLLNTSFEIEPNERVHPWIVRDMDKRGSKSFSQVGNHVSGDFLRNRSWQGIGMRYIEPTRSEVTIEAVEGEGFEAYSSISANLEKILYIDSDGASWIAEDLGQGGRKPLEKVQGNQANDFWLTIEERTNHNQYRKVRNWSRNVRGGFVAFTGNIQEIPALEFTSINNLDEFTVVCGLSSEKEAQ